jgi:uncharacterized membrane protein
MIAPRRYRYGLLLGLIAVSLSFQLAAPVADWSRLVTVALQGATLVLALRTSQARPLLVRIAAVAVAAALVGSVTAVLSGGDAGSDSTVLTSALLVGLAPAGIAAGVVRSIREDQGVSIATMFGVLCIYLLLGMFFAFAYGTISTLDSAAFFAQQSNPTQADFLYFSYTTLTTTGFGDLTAATGLGRAVTISEALVGQVYLVTIVAAIVSNLRPRHA